MSKKWKQTLITLFMIFGVWRLFEVPLMPHTLLGWIGKLVTGFGGAYLASYCMEEE